MLYLCALLSIFNGERLDEWPEIATRGQKIRITWLFLKQVKVSVLNIYINNVVVKIPNSQRKHYTSDLPIQILMYYNSHIFASPVLTFQMFS